MKKKILEKDIEKFMNLKKLRKDKRYLITDETPVRSYGEFRNFQRFIENMITLSRHKGIKIYGGLMIVKEDDFE